MSIWMPMWSIDLYRRRERGSHNADDRCPILIAGEERQQQVVKRCCERARAAGVRRGMVVAQARALFPIGGVRIEAHDASRDAAALRSFAEWAHRFSPTVAIDEPDGLMLDVSGCSRVWKGENRLVRSAVADIGRLGFRVRAAIAPSFGCAWACARFGSSDSVVVPNGKSRESLAPLPLESLRIEPCVVDALRGLGIERVEQVMSLPRSTLPVRFGDSVLLRLDQALGQAIETIEPVRPVPPPGVERVFDGPTDRMEVIELATRALLCELCGHLEERSCGVRTLEVGLIRSDLEPEWLTVTLGRPSRDPKQLWSLLQPKMEAAHLGFGVEAVRVCAAALSRIRHVQAEQGWDARTPAVECARQLDELIDTLCNRLGRERVVRVTAAESYWPERAIGYAPAQGFESAQGFGAVQGCSVDRVGVRVDRPTVLFDRIEPVHAITLAPDGPVHQIVWRGLEHRIVVSRGPERVSPEWWRGGNEERDYFAVQSESGLWLWLCRRTWGNSKTAWGVHGVWA